MAADSEQRILRCCFTGHRPEKLNASDKDVKLWLENQTDKAINDGYLTFISGCAMGRDLWAGEIVLGKRAENPDIHLIAAVPWPGFGKSWNMEWRKLYDNLLRNADLVVNVSDHYHRGVFQQRNVWMVDRSSRMIAYYNGTAGGTRNTIEYAKKQGIEIVCPANSKI